MQRLLTQSHPRSLPRPMAKKHRRRLGQLGQHFVTLALEHIVPQPSKVHLDIAELTGTG